MTARKIFAGGEFLVNDCSPGDVFVPEEFSEEHRMIYKTAFDFVKKEIWPNLERLDQQDEELIRYLFLKAGEIGLNGTDVPEEYGGLGLDKISSCLVAEAIGNAGSFAVSHGNQTGIGSLPIVFFGSEEQKLKYLPKLVSGEWIGAYCLTEPNAGSDALNIRTRAVLSADGKHYILNGEKIFITNSAWADSFIVYAKVGGDKFTAFIVERTCPGITTGPEEKKMGIKGSSTRSVVFQDCAVPVESLLFEIGQGHKVAFNALNMGRYKLGAFTLGGCKTSIGHAAKYANGRIQFGKPISSFGLIKQKLAEMAVKTYMAESLSYRVAAMIEDKLSSLTPEAMKSGTEMAKAIEEYAVECSICKVFDSECLDYCVDEWVQILGGYGYCAEFPAERGYRDARINRIFEGTNEINRLLMSGTLFRRAMQGRLPLVQAAAEAASATESYDPEVPLEAKGTLAAERSVIGFCKKVALLAATAAANKFGVNLTEEQEILAMLSDMMMECFAMESGLLRAEKFMASHGEDKASIRIAAVKIYTNDAVARIASWVETTLAYLKDGQDLTMLSKASKKLVGYRAADTVTLRRLVADTIIGLERYPFGD